LPRSSASSRSRSDTAWARSTFGFSRPGGDGELRSRRQRKDGGKVSASSDRFAGRSGITNPSSHAPSFSFNRITVATTRLRLKTVLSLESVVIEDEGHELEVNVSLSTPCGYKAGSRYQFIGELDRRRNGSGHGVSPPRIHLSGSLSVRAPPHSGSLTIVSLWRGRSRRRRFWWPESRGT